MSSSEQFVLFFFFFLLLLLLLLLLILCFLKIYALKCVNSHFYTFCVFDAMVCFRNNFGRKSYVHYVCLSITREASRLNSEQLFEIELLLCSCQGKEGIYSLGMPFIFSSIVLSLEREV